MSVNESTGRLEDGAQTGRDPRRIFWFIGGLFPRNPVVEAIRTRARFDVPPADVWQKMMFYEDVPQRPPWLLRMMLPTPVKTQSGDKRVGTNVQCTYSHGSLVKRFTALEPPGLVRFVVVDQRLGVESCVTTVEGSYEIVADGAGSLVTLTTKYRGHLRPRALWRPLERVLAHQLHNHILDGMGGQRVG